MMERIKFLKKYFLNNKIGFLFSFGILILLSVISIIPNLFLKRIFDYGFPNKDIKNIVLPALIMLCLYSFKSLLNYKSLFIINNWSQKIVAQIRDDVTEKLMSLPMEFYDLNDPSYVAARVSEVNNLLSIFSQSSIKSVVCVLEFIGVLIILLKTNLYLTLILLSITPFFITVSNNYARSLKKTSAMVLENSSRLNSRIQQSFKNIEEIKNLSVEKEEQNKLKKVNLKLLKSSIEQSNTISRSTELLVFLSSLSTVVLIVSGGLFIVKSDLTIGTYMVFTSLLGKLYAPVQTLSMLSITLSPAFTSLDRIIDFMNEPIDMGDEINYELINLNTIKSIEFKNVSFKYKTSSKQVLKNLNFEIKDSEKLCLKGNNGSGKTTIFRLLLSLYDIDSGEILLNNRNYKNYNKSDIRSKIGIISQKIKLFPGTIEENIRYGSNITDEEYKIKMADEKIVKLMKELPNDIVITNGDNLSGGQIQRIAIARGLIRNADLFLFDEATSSLDKEGTQSLIHLVDEILKNKMCIFIEHSDIVDLICDKQIIL